MEQQQKLEMAERIKTLREVGPYNQPTIAEKLGIGLRGYQKLEVKGTTQYERCQELFDIHSEWISERPEWAHVTAAWIWDGREGRAPTPDPFAAASQNGSSAMSADLAALERAAIERHAEMMAELAELRLLVEDLGRPEQPGGQSRAGG